MMGRVKTGMDPVWCLQKLHQKGTWEHIAVHDFNYFRPSHKGGGGGVLHLSTVSCKIDTYM